MRTRKQVPRRRSPPVVDVHELRDEQRRRQPRQPWVDPNPGDRTGRVSARRRPVDSLRRGRSTTRDAGSESAIDRDGPTERTVRPTALERTELFRGRPGERTQMCGRCRPIHVLRPGSTPVPDYSTVATESDSYEACNLPAELPERGRTAVTVGKQPQPRSRFLHPRFVVSSATSPPSRPLPSAVTTRFRETPMTVQRVRAFRKGMCRRCGGATRLCIAETPVIGRARTVGRTTPFPTEEARRTPAANSEHASGSL